MRRFRGLSDSVYTITGNRLTYSHGRNGTAARYGGAGNGKADKMNPYIDKGTDEIIDKAIDELVEWSQLHGYDPKGSGFSSEFLDTAADYVFGSMEKPEDYDFSDVLQKAKDDGVFETLRIRDFNKECLIDGPKCTIGLSDSGKVGIFYDGSFGHCGEGYREIGRDEVPLNWFTDYAVYTSWDVWGI